jgi:hypothetical protein
MDAEVGIEPTIRDLQSPALPLGYPASAIPTSFYFAAARIAFIIRWAKHNREPADATGFLHALALHLAVKFHHVWVVHVFPAAEVVVVVVHKSIISQVLIENLHALVENFPEVGVRLLKLFFGFFVISPLAKDSRIARHSAA